MDTRHEWKHEVSLSDMLALRQRLRAVMEPDAHMKDGRYEIRSLYFDTLSDKALREKIDGVNVREKFRIRYYNGDTSFLRLEKKSKRGGCGSKQSVRLEAAEVRALAEGERRWMLERGEPLLAELYRKMTCQGLRPRTIVDYTREAFAFAPGGVRVTLDHDIRTALGCAGFLDPACVTVPVPGGPVILEVKWGSFLPSVIRDAVQLEGRRTSAFSKYAACRIYG